MRFRFFPPKHMKATAPGKKRTKKRRAEGDPSNEVSISSHLDLPTPLQDRCFDVGQTFASSGSSMFLEPTRLRLVEDGLLSATRRGRFSTTRRRVGRCLSTRYDGHASVTTDRLTTRLTSPRETLALPEERADEKRETKRRNSSETAQLPKHVLLDGASAERAGRLYERDGDDR